MCTLPNVRWERDELVPVRDTCLVGFCDNTVSPSRPDRVYCDEHDTTVHPSDSTFRLATLAWDVRAPQWWSDDESDAVLVLLDELRGRVEGVLIDGLDEISGALSIKRQP